jgi:cytochrome c oxidase subunit II
LSSKNRGRAAAALVAVLAVAAFAASARAADPWRLMPESASAEADEIDGLTYLVLWITGIAFVGVQALLVIFLVKYRARPGQKAKFTHGNHAVELVWTVAPALILVFLALYQMGLWVDLKRPHPQDNAGATSVQIFAKQFEWNIRYPDPDAPAGTDPFDSAHARLVTGAMVVPVGRPVNATLRSMDVIHSFYLPNFRFKQDAVPGLTIPFWFKPTVLSMDRSPVPNRDGVPQKLAYWDIVCAELCGHSHTTMAAQLYVLTEEQYARWWKDPASVTDVPGLPKWRYWDKADAMTAQDAVWARWSWQDKKYDLADPKNPRALLAPAKLKREPFGTDDKPGGESKPEDM